MKRTLLILSILILGLFLYTQFITGIYANRQAKCICSWINEEKGSKPAVGPQAYEHLTWLQKDSKGNYDCLVIKPNRKFNSSNVKTVQITENGIEKLRLNYTLSYGGRSFLQPIYFHHQSDTEHQH